MGGVQGPVAPDVLAAAVLLLQPCRPPRLAPQAHALPSLQRRLLPPEALEAMLSESEGGEGGEGGRRRPLAWLAEIGGAPAAAVVLEHTPGPDPGAGDLSLALAAVHPGLEERVEIFYALR